MCVSLLLYVFLVPFIGSFYSVCFFLNLVCLSLTYYIETYDACICSNERKKGIWMGGGRSIWGNEREKAIIILYWEKNIYIQIKKLAIWKPNSFFFLFYFFKSQTDVEINLVHQLIKYMTLGNRYVIVI